MFTRIISSIMLVAMLNMLIGCSMARKIGFNKFTNESRKTSQPMKISKAILSKSISGIKLHTGEEVYFERQSGKYDAESGTISGISNNNKKVEYLLEYLDSVYIKTNTIEDPLIDEIDINSFRYYAIENPWNIIDNQCLNEGVEIEFDKYGATFDARGFKLVGTTFSGQYVNITTDKIYRIEYSRSDEKKLLTVVYVAGAVALIVYLIIEYDKFFSGDWD